MNPAGDFLSIKSVSAKNQSCSRQSAQRVRQHYGFGYFLEVIVGFRTIVGTLFRSTSSGSASSRNPQQGFPERQGSARRLAPADVRGLRGCARIRRWNRPAALYSPPTPSLFSRLFVHLRSVFFPGRFWRCRDHVPNRGPICRRLWLADKRSVRKIVLAGLPHRFGRSVRINWLDCCVRRVFLWRIGSTWPGFAALGNTVGGFLCLCRLVRRILVSRIHAIHAGG